MSPFLRWMTPHSHPHVLMLVSLSSFFVSSYSLFQNARKHQSPILIGTSWHPNLAILLLAHLISLITLFVSFKPRFFGEIPINFLVPFPEFGWNHEHGHFLLGKLRVSGVKPLRSRKLRARKFPQDQRRRLDRTVCGGAAGGGWRGHGKMGIWWDIRW